ncbi:MAG: RNA chaperone Hfq [Armatimonadetes bacterium]|nr:RNA chaperone Hfq [Armatimonadota bacterium]MDE2205424.1 RNA chaperone Hfq [Armatimonadota bacterium]
MNKMQLNLQDIFLNQVRKENIGVTIYLIGSVQLRGYVRGFDAFTILLDSGGKPTQLVYKHAVTSIVPSRPVPNFHQDAHREPRSEHSGDRARQVVESDGEVSEVAEDESVSAEATV